MFMLQYVYLVVISLIVFFCYRRIKTITGDNMNNRTKYYRITETVVAGLAGIISAVILNNAIMMSSKVTVEKRWTPAAPVEFQKKEITNKQIQPVHTPEERSTRLNDMLDYKKDYDRILSDELNKGPLVDKVTPDTIEG